MPPALQAACGDGPRRAWQPGVRAPAQPQSRGQTTVPAEGPESRKDLKGSVSPSARSSQQPPAARLPRGPRVSQQDGGTACPPRPVPGSSTGPARHTGQARPSRLLAPRPGTRGPQNQQHRARQCGLFISNRVCTRWGLPSLLRGHPRVEDSGLQRSDSLPHAARRRRPWLGLTRGRPVPHPRCSLRALSLSPGFAKAALWAVRRQRGPRGAQGRVRRDRGDLSVRRG